MTKLKELRKEKKVSQNDIAKILGVTGQAYSYYERDERELGYAALIKLAKYFDVSIDYLLGNSSFYYPDTVKQSASLALTEEEKMILNNFRTMRPDLRETFIKMSETLAQPSDAITGSSNKKKA